MGTGIGFHKFPCCPNPPRVRLQGPVLAAQEYRAFGSCFTMSAGEDLPVFILSHLINTVSFWEDSEPGGCRPATGISLFLPPSHLCVLYGKWVWMWMCGQPPASLLRLHPMSFTWTWGFSIERISLLNQVPGVYLFLFSPSTLLLTQRALSLEASCS